MPDIPSPPRDVAPQPAPPRHLPPAPSPPRSFWETLTVLPRPVPPAVPARILAGAAAVAGVTVAVVVVVIALRGPPATPEPLVLPRAVPTTAGEAEPAGDAETAGPDAGTDGGNSSRSRSGAYVHAAGAVARPGVYRVRAGGRVSDLLDAAGGPAGDADLDQVNLAARVADGERVYVPRRGESPPPMPGPSGTAGAGAGGGSASGPLNLNTATLEQLDGLPGVGPATAQAILDYRKARGRFRSVDELMEVRGIGEAKLAAIRSKVRV